MFGQNPIRHADMRPDSVAVQEIFYTIQGEGPFTGCPAVFVRLAGCNLACTFCDTEFETGMDNRLSFAGVAESVELCAQLAKLPELAKKLVVLTGGEPLRQNVVELINCLLLIGVEHVQIETAGTLWQDGLAALIEDGDVSLVCSPKTPRIHPMISRWCKHYKYILTSGDVSDEDGLPWRGTQVGNAHLTQQIHRPWIGGEPRAPGMLVPTVWVAPCDEHDEVRNKANTDLAARIAMRYGYRLSIQMHKVIGLP